MKKIIIGSISLLMFFLYSHAFARDMTFKEPAGEVLLSISSSQPLLQSNVGNELQLDREQLSQFDMVSVKTATRWTDGISVYRGPLLRDVLKVVGIKSNLVSAIAFNEYQVEIPYEDFQNYNVILAMERDGVPLTVRSKGPLWVIYPWSDFSELDKDEFYSRSIWQLVHLKSNEQN